MKRKIILFILTATLIFGSSIQSSYAIAISNTKLLLSSTQTKNVTVYITETGKKYHKAGCRYLRQSKIPIKLNDAEKNGYEACKVCNPPK